MKSAEIRQKFLDFFSARDHEVVSSSPLVPGNDPTLLFTNAGMVQFKEAFLGEEKRATPRATSSQRCVRAGGKHNDLENVGYTARHHTFFEMLGNFSFGDYFKREAIQYAWEFLTEDLGLPAEKLWVTVFEDDDEAASIWLDEMKIDPMRFTRMGEKDNFWAMGDTGPCGPCSELFYDHGPDVEGGPPGSPNEDGDRYIEIWNLVFMQYERKADGSMIPLPKPSVDTGAGLERLAAVMQHVHSNYEIDLFQALIKDIAQITGQSDLNNDSLNVIADHIRSCAFLVVDGVVPSNEGRGYVLRRIIRRAIRHGYQLGVEDVLFYKLVDSLAKVMGSAYPELVERQAMVERVLKVEEEQFARTLENGMAILEKAIANLDGDTIPGDTVFQLYDTYGFPVDLTADVARGHELKIDLDGFDKAMEVQKESARAASNFGAVEKLDIDPAVATDFTGYSNLEDTGKVIGIFSNENEKLEAAPLDEEVLLLLDKSPFYGESGGQIGDHGSLQNSNANFSVLDTQKQGDAHIHRGVLKKGSLKVGDEVSAEVAGDDRHAITLNHSATHLMHSALRNVLGTHVTQKGSLVAEDRLRFDFSHSSPLTEEELSTIEAQVNAEILANSEVSKDVMPLDEAKKRGALALFGEKYGDEVRVVTMGGEYSIEFCGGCHVDRTGDIGLFKITSETGISAGVRRVEAVTGKGALALINQEEQIIKQVGAIVKSSAADLVDRVRQLSDSNKAFEKEIEQLKAKLASSAGDDLTAQATEMNGAKVLVANVEGFNPKSLRDTVDQLKNKLGSSIILLATTADEKVSLIAGVSKDLTGKVKAGDLVNMVAEQVGGKGGGRPDMAMAGGTDTSAVSNALDSVKPWLEGKL
ncbi:MAG: alanine--tRNA ligase [Pseudomonadales bacterium]|nr:alanine--tRNA ligase [Pseudomonadales bacterium]